MSEDKLSQNEQLFFQLVTQFSTSAWIGLGKIKNPMTDKVERDLNQASFSIDMLDMISERMGDNLSKDERQFLDASLGNLKLNYMEEMKNQEKAEEEEEASQAEDESDNEPENEEGDKEVENN